MTGGRIAALALWLAAGHAWAALEVDALWDYGRPDASEQRFREALAGARGDDALVLRTQIARTYGLRKRFDDAHRELDAIEPQLTGAGDEPRVRHALERGRTLRSAGAARDAEPRFRQAFEWADRAGLENLAADALHMLALVQPDLAGQLEWNRRVVAYARAAGDPRARGWEAVALNNIGVALNQAGRHQEALAALRDAQIAYQRLGRVESVRIARWMVAYTLRLLGRLDEALAMQQALAGEWAAAGGADPYVFEELALIHAARGDAERAAQYRQRAAGAR